MQEIKGRYGRFDGEGRLSQPSYLWVAALVVGWPLFALAMALLRWGQPPASLPQLISQLVGFGRVGLYSGAALLFMLRRAATLPARRFAIGGYLLAAPVGYLLGLWGPITLGLLAVLPIPQVVTTLVLAPLAIGFWGALPPVGGAAAGLWMGSG